MALGSMPMIPEHRKYLNKFYGIRRNTEGTLGDNRDELMTDWELATSGEKVFQIEPLK